MPNILQQITAHKKIEVEQRKTKTPLDSFKTAINKSDRSLANALTNSHSDFILECKKASPSKGLIRPDFDIEQILNGYKNFASAISVLTDTHYFQGELEFLSRASQLVKQPILAKDFFIDEYQVYEARYYGADAILLMLSVLDDKQYIKLSQIADSLNLDILTEVHNQSELKRAINLDAKIIGINNRNLNDLSIDIANTEVLAKYIPDDRIIISESGITNNQDVRRLAPLVDAFLVGSSLMQQKNIGEACKRLIYGAIKICGITRIEDAISADKNGAIFVGFIFHPQSKRLISLANAKLISEQTSLNYVGVFVNQPIEQVVDYAIKLKLYAVQLHGYESEDYITELKAQFFASKTTTQIWKAAHIKQTTDDGGTDKDLLKTSNTNVDKYLLDTYTDKAFGGTGQSFDWNILYGTFAHIDKNTLIIAGGIKLSNINRAKEFNPFAIDLSSGVEVSPGMKCPQKLAELFSELRTKSLRGQNDNT